MLTKIFLFIRKLHSRYGAQLSLVEKGNYLFRLYEASWRHSSNGRYLDIGSGSRITTEVFSSKFAQACALDLSLPQPESFNFAEAKFHFIFGSAETLPFRHEMFDVVSMFSLIEHVQNQQLALSEALRVVRRGGCLLIEIPNRYFPIDTHSAFLNPLMLPPSLRSRLLGIMGYTDIPSKGKLKSMLLSSEAGLEIESKSVIWPYRVPPLKFRPLYFLIRMTGILRALPLGYFFICHKPLPGEIRWRGKGGVDG